MNRGKEGERGEGMKKRGRQRERGKKEGREREPFSGFVSLKHCKAIYAFCYFLVSEETSESHRYLGW